nr:hypothetical protein [Tanacetum cinerariifolium]
EAVNEEMYDSLERATTIATSLDAEQDRGNIKKKKKLRTHELKRLYKLGLIARVESFDEESLSEEDASKQGRKIVDIDAEKGLTLIDETIEDQGRINNEDMFDTYDEIFVESVDVLEQVTGDF